MSTTSINTLLDIWQSAPLEIRCASAVLVAILLGLLIGPRNR